MDAFQQMQAIHLYEFIRYLMTKRTKTKRHSQPKQLHALNVLHDLQVMTAANWIQI